MYISRTRFTVLRTQRVLLFPPHMCLLQQRDFFHQNIPADKRKDTLIFNFAFQ